MDTQTIDARFGVMVSGRVAEVKVIGLHAVLGLNEAYSHLVNARVVAGPLPSERWNRLLDGFASEAAIPSSLAGLTADASEHADRFARELFVAAAAFLAAEANDLEDHISLLAADRQKDVRMQLDGIANKVGDTADALIVRRVENITWQQFGDNAPSGSRTDQLDEARGQPAQPSRVKAVSRRIAYSGPAATVGTLITFLGEIFLRKGSWQILLAVGVLLCFGALLGTSWNSRSVTAKVRQNANERRMLNERSLAVSATYKKYCSERERAYATARDQQERSYDDEDYLERDIS